MRYTKRLFAMILALVMTVSVMGVSAEAAMVEGSPHELYYITYNEKNEVVDEGIIPVNGNGRYTWSGSITVSYTHLTLPTIA
mgnify:CR=1 FL=1